MATVTFGMRTSLPPDRVMSMLTDFSSSRPEVWPTLAPQLYEVYSVDLTAAHVKEGSLRPVVIWERCHYEWSTDRVRWTVHASNYCKPGSYVEVTVGKGAGLGSQIYVEWNRTGVGFKGKALIAFVVLSGGAIIRRKVFQRAFDRAVRLLAKG